MFNNLVALFLSLAVMQLSTEVSKAPWLAEVVHVFKHVSCL